MSLIIGCVTKNFGIIVGDTQLSIGDLNRNEIRRETKIKLNSPAINFAYGILNKWTQYVVDPKKPSELTIIEEDKRLKRFINNPSIIDKAKYLKEYMKTLSKIDATAIFIEKSEDDSFNLEEVSSQSKENLSHLKKGDLSLLFNEPFYNINSSYVKSLLNDFYNDKKLSNSLEDIIYLLNNVLLKVISQGPNFNLLNNKGESDFVSSSTVGGYVTLTLITKDNLNKLYFCYGSDYNTLLDKRTLPFANYVDRNKHISYIDNLAMLVHNATSEFNYNLRKVLIQLIYRQILIIHDNNLLDSTKLNEIINKINEKHKLSIKKLEESDSSEFDSIIINGIEIDRNGNEIDMEYLKSFF